MLRGSRFGFERQGSRRRKGVRDVAAERKSTPPPGETIEFRLPQDRDAAAKARRIVEEHLTPLVPADRCDDLTLAVSELVTNAVRHAPPLDDGTIILTFEASDDVVRVAVIDGGTHLTPDELTFHTGDDGEFGLFFVNNVVDGWGFSLDGVKGVWFTIERGDA
jgi:serine/threonine-protein kinase RsbW